LPPTDDDLTDDDPTDDDPTTDDPTTDDPPTDDPTDDEQRFAPAAQRFACCLHLTKHGF
jgi:hypothetical protein